MHPVNPRDYKTIFSTSVSEKHTILSKNLFHAFIDDGDDVKTSNGKAIITDNSNCEKMRRLLIQI